MLDDLTDLCTREPATILQSDGFHPHFCDGGPSLDMNMNRFWPITRIEEEPEPVGPQHSRHSSSITQSFDSVQLDPTCKCETTAPGSILSSMSCSLSRRTSRRSHLSRIPGFPQHELLTGLGLRKSRAGSHVDSISFALARWNLAKDGSRGRRSVAVRVTLARANRDRHCWPSPAR